MDCRQCESANACVPWRNSASPDPNLRLIFVSSNHLDSTYPDLFPLLLYSYLFKIQQMEWEKTSAIAFFGNRQPSRLFCLILSPLRKSAFLMVLLWVSPVNRGGCSPVNRGKHTPLFTCEYPPLLHTVSIPYRELVVSKSRVSRELLIAVNLIRLWRWLCIPSAVAIPTVTAILEKRLDGVTVAGLSACIESRV